MSTGLLVALGVAPSSHAAGGQARCSKCLVIVSGMNLERSIEPKTRACEVAQLGRRSGSEERLADRVVFEPTVRLTVLLSFCQRVDSSSKSTAGKPGSSGDVEFLCRIK